MSTVLVLCVGCHVHKLCRWSTAAGLTSVVAASIGIASIPAASVPAAGIVRPYVRVSKVPAACMALVSKMLRLVALTVL